MSKQVDERAVVSLEHQPVRVGIWRMVNRDVKLGAKEEIAPSMTAVDDREHLLTVARVLVAQGWPTPEVIAEATRAEGPLGWIGGHGDPFFAVVARKPPA